MTTKPSDAKPRVSEGAAEAKPGVTYDRCGRGMNREEEPLAELCDCGLPIARGHVSGAKDMPGACYAKTRLADGHDIDECRHAQIDGLQADRDRLLSQLTAAQSALEQANARVMEVEAERDHWKRQAEAHTLETEQPTRSNMVGTGDVRFAKGTLDR